MSSKVIEAEICVCVCACTHATVSPDEMCLLLQFAVLPHCPFTQPLYGMLPKGVGVSVLCVHIMQMKFK